MTKYKYYAKDIKELEPGECFVFGSNLIGRHGAGAARYARNQFDAVYGVGVGFTGRCYALPTKDHNIETMELSFIKHFVDLFFKDTEDNPDLTFLVTKVGCGLAGYNDKDIAPMFRGAPDNCIFHEDWKEYLE